MSAEVAGPVVACNKPALFITQTPALAVRGLKHPTRLQRELASKIEDVELRKRASAFVDFFAVRAALEQKNTEGALRIIRSGELSPIQRVWAYTEIAQFRKADPIGALELLRDAAAEARRIDNANPQRVQALIAIATSFYEVDPLRAWDAMAEAVKAASYTDDFKGEAGKVTADLRTRSMVARFDFDVPRFDLNNIFSLLAKDDLQRAIELAKRFSAEEPRAIAIFAIARSVLEEKKGKNGCAVVMSPVADLNCSGCWMNVLCGPLRLRGKWVTQ